MQNVHMATKERIAPQALGMEVAALLREAVARREMTQARVAEKAGISTSQVSKYLRGVRPITIDELDRLCSSIGINFERLIVEAVHRTRAEGGWWEPGE